jgi:hypothetical protein
MHLNFILQELLNLKRIYNEGHEFLKALITKIIVLACRYLRVLLRNLLIQDSVPIFPRRHILKIWKWTENVLLKLR